jgi:hypothetical protein
MFRTPASIIHVAERLCRPQRVGIFGHRGVGKTTLITLLYREAVAGRLPGLRLAAADARTANYLSDKIVHLEAGQKLPATLAETDLRLHLYHHTDRLDLLIKDYQGEHVELGRAEPIRDFLRDCDVVCLCLDSGLLVSSDLRWERQQEIEQVVEDYLATEPAPELHRPMALVLTKADCLGPQPDDSGALAREQFGLASHALQTHCPSHDFLAVSCLETSATDPLRIQLAPRNLDSLLIWLVSAVQRQDESRLNWLWGQRACPPALLERCFAEFARRFPESAATGAFRQQIRQARWQRYRRRGLATAAAITATMVSLWGYDALGHYQARRFEEDNPAAAGASVERWQAYQAWHPTRFLTRASTPESEESHLVQLQTEARRQECETRLAEMRRRAEDPEVNAEALWEDFRRFHADYPEAATASDVEGLRSALKARRDDVVESKAGQAYAELQAAEGRSADLADLVQLADRFLHRFAGTALESEFRQRRDAYLARMDERLIEVARSYSAKNPFNFQTRREHYQRYLDRYPAGAAATEARSGLENIDREWDRYDFRAVRDQFLKNPANIPELVARCRTYLAVHPQGRFTASATELLRWTERVTAPGEYRVILRNGQFEKKLARFLSRGPDLSVEIEAAGVKYGPSSFTKNRYDPEWNYEYPRRIRWKLGDPVIVRIIDNDWRKRVVVEIDSAADDALAMHMLTGDLWCGENRITFESDFRWPSLPKIE